MIVSTAPATVRGTAGVVTSAGRMIKLSVLEFPALPPSAHFPGLSGGTPIGEFVSLEPGEAVVALAPLDTAAAGLALGTASGVVKRVLADYPQARDEFEVITLKEGDQVVGAVQLSSESPDLVFVSSDGQLLRFPASAVRPQGRIAGGMAGIRLSPGASVIWFGAVDPGGWARACRSRLWVLGLLPASGSSGPSGCFRPRLFRPRGCHRGRERGRLAGCGGRERKGQPVRRIPV